MITTVRYHPNHPAEEIWAVEWCSLGVEPYLGARLAVQQTSPCAICVFAIMRGPKVN